jgi:replicative DNA helicase
LPHFGELITEHTHETLRSLAETLDQIEYESTAPGRGLQLPLPLGFSPLDDLLNGGLRPGELMIVGGAAGVGKTIFGLQLARNVALRQATSGAAGGAMYVCFEHDPAHLTMRLLCQESAVLGQGEDALTMARLAKLTAIASGSGTSGLITLLRREPKYGAVVAALERYAGRLFLVRASGRHSTLDRIADAAVTLARSSPASLLVVDYLQKIPVDSAALAPESEATTFLAQGLKDLALETGLRVVAIAALDHDGLRQKRMRFADLRGSSALQYEADVGLIFNNKYDIVSREHLVYNEQHAPDLQGWLVMTVEKNRAGRARVDMEYALDAAHFRLLAKGGYVRERLIDERMTLA